MRTTVGRTVDLQFRRLEKVLGNGQARHCTQVSPRFDTGDINVNGLRFSVSLTLFVAGVGGVARRVCNK